MDRNQALELMAANRGLFDMLINGYDAEWFKDQMQGLITGPIRHLVVRGQQAGVIRPDVDGTDFAGIWGGATRSAWRGRGIYRALTAERARSALRMGKKYINSDSTEFSRPILERSGLVKVSTTTPYNWKR